MTQHINSGKSKGSGGLPASIPVFMAFLCMGFGDAVGPFVGLAREEFELSNTMAQLIPFAGFIMFGLLSVPMGIYQDKKGKKFILMLGLIIAMAGLLVPVIGGLESYALFLVTVLMLGAGATILQVAGNPIMRDVSPGGKYARNLSLGQFVKAIGSLSGPLIPVIAARWLGMGWELIFPVYSVAVLVTIILLASTRIHEFKSESDQHASFASSLGLLKNPYVLMMVLGIFLYVGAEVSMSSNIPLYLEDSFGIDIKTLGVAGSGFFFIAIMTGRFLGSVILNWISAKRFLVITAFVSIIGIAGLFTGNQLIAIISIFVTGLGFANVFPLIFSITVDRMPERSNELSGLMVTAILGGAILPVFSGVVSDLTSVAIGFTVPLLALVYILFVGFKINRL
ncbi:MAG: MFS transporter [Bacteroidales bacterium]|nr:MFS transporter [Bacteroidales bacterium]